MMTDTQQILTPKALAFAAAHLGATATDLAVQSVSGGYSLNRRAVVSAKGQSIFVKEVDVSLLPDDGATERLWLKKDAATVSLLADKGIRAASDWAKISDDNEVLLLPAYRIEDGWLWQVPEAPEQRAAYIEAVLSVAAELEQVVFTDSERSRIALTPFFRDEMVASGGLEMLRDVPTRLALAEKYAHILRVRQLPDRVRDALAAVLQLIENDGLVDMLIHQKNSLGLQEENCFGQCDLRPDNLAYDPATGRVVLVDWNWASYTPKGFGSTEFLISVATKGYDVTNWASTLNGPLLAACVSYWFERCLKPSFNPQSTVREDQAVSAATSYSLYRKSQGVNS